MSASPTPAAAALDAFGVPGARVVHTVVENHLAAVIVVAAAYDPPVTRFYLVAQTQDGWRLRASGALGLRWITTSPTGERGIVYFGVETPSYVTEVHLRIDGTHHAVPTPDGYGAMVIIGQAPNPSWEVSSDRTADGQDVTGAPPPARTFINQGNPAQLATIGDARHFLWATQLQIERFVTAFRRDVHRSADVPPTPEDQRNSSLAFAEAEFLLNAAGQADKALRRVRGGPRLSAKMSKDIRMLRNLHEHWDQHRASFAHPHLPKVKAAENFATQYPAERPWVFQFGAEGNYISVLRLEDLWDELEVIDRELGRMNNAALDGTAVSHIIKDENRTPRPMPQPVADRTLAMSVLRQPLLIGEP
jgi:hypothetical protein